MNEMTDFETIPQIIERQFNNAKINPSVARWKSCSLMAGYAAVRFAAEGDHYLSACLKGVADEARRKAISITTEESQKVFTWKKMP